MARLWAHWRSKYVQSVDDEDAGPTSGCIFCDYPAEPPEAHRARYVLSVGEQVFIILNRFPYNPGHLMVVPRRHVSDPTALGAATYSVLSECLRRATWAVGEAFSPDGINVGMNIGRAAGAGIDAHCHYHVVPRWGGDTNFMPVVGETRVMSVGLDECYEQLLPMVGELVPAVEQELAAEERDAT